TPATPPPPHTTTPPPPTPTATTSTTPPSTPTPTGTTTTTPLDHFQCYEIKPATIPPTTVTVEDQFGTQGLTLRFPHRLCAPADKNGEGVSQEIQHLVGYDTLRSPFTKVTGFPVTNQFGTTAIDLTRRDLLMVPTAKSLVAPPPPLLPPSIDHFHCYRA